jgi:CheY-like chemotaxis protein
VAPNGKEGVEAVEERLKAGGKMFDLIFMDIHMPVMDGLDAAFKINELGVKVPIVALTANIMSNDLEHYKISGMSDFLGKPFTSQELWKCLIKYIPVESYSTEDKDSLSAEDEKLQKKLKINFTKDNQTTYADIMNAVNSGDIKKAHRMAHTLKSTAGQIREKRLQEIAAATEARLSGMENKLNEEQTRSLETEIKAVLGRLAPLLFEADTNKTAKTADTEKAREIIEKLEPMLKNKNPGCEDLLDEIHTIPGTEELAQLIEKFKFKQAADELANLKKAWGLE